MVAAAAFAGCSSATQQSVARDDAPLTPAAQAKADSGRPPYTAADVAFMQGMIAHHAQALVMAGLAPTHSTPGGIRILAERIDVSQRDEIALMQSWLRERDETVPDAHAGHGMPGHQMPMPGMPASGPLMPGMLTPEQMAQLEAARSAEFDRLFLTFMIQHHEGALVMVKQLFSSPGAGQEVNVFIFASDVAVDQTTEIDRMRTMLPARTTGAGRP